jgi:glycosyltransferase involved in cell wall biosynthesis
MGELVSVCITTKNEEPFLESCLRSVLNQTYDNIEIIVADSNSNDRTIDIAKKYANNVVIKETSMTQGRNLAAKYARGNILCFLDADIILQKDWLDILVPYLYDEENVAAYGNMYPIEKNLKSHVLYACNNIVNRALQIAKKPCYSKAGTAVIVRRDVFEKVGGFSEDITAAEDHDFSLKLSKYGKLKYDGHAKSHVSMRRLERSGYANVVFHWIRSSLTILRGKRPTMNYTKDFP